MSDRLLTPTQIERIRTLRLAGRSCAVIARLVGSCPSTVRSRCRRLGVRSPVEHRGGWQRQVARHPAPDTPQRPSHAFVLQHYWDSP